MATRIWVWLRDMARAVLPVSDKTDIITVHGLVADGGLMPGN